MLVNPNDVPTSCCLTAIIYVTSVNIKSSLVKL